MCIFVNVFVLRVTCKSVCMRVCVYLCECVCVVCDLQVCVHERECVYFCECVCVACDYDSVCMWYVNVWCANVCVRYYRGSRWEYVKDKSHVN